VSLINLLIEALFAIYSRAGAEVTYITDRGERRPYWANRYLQALKRAVAEGPEAVPVFVERLINQPEPSRGFSYLKAAGRLDLSVEALVVDASQPFHSLFSSDVVAAAKARLEEHGWNPPAFKETNQSEPATQGGTLAATLLGGNKGMTTTATWWYLTAVNGLRSDQVAALNAAIKKRSIDNDAPMIGGNHVLLALVDTGLYQRVWPGSEDAAA
jgi:hypothetical protein